MSLLPRPTSRRSLLRAVLMLVGALALLGGAAWSAAAAGFGIGSDDDDAQPAAAPARAAEPTPEVKLTGDGLLAWLDAVGALEGLDKVAENAPFGAKAFFEDTTGFEFLPFVREKIASAVGDGISLTDLDAKLDDIDGDGDPASDFHGVEGLTLDLDVDLAARTTPGAYDVKIALDAKAAEDSPLAMNLDGLRINGKDAADALELDLGTTLRLDPSAAKKIVIPAQAGTLGTVRLGVDGAYEGDGNPLAFQVGVLGVKATGTVAADAGVQVDLKDPNSDGVIDLQELTTPSALLRPSCVSDGAAVDLTVTGDLAGISGEVGRLTLEDESLCNGLAAPEVELGDLAQFRNVTLGDVVNGLAQVTQALKSAQAAGDVPIPFVQEPLRDLVSVNEKLVQFFVDNGFTDADNPMASISVDTKEDAAVKTLQDLAPRLATALGMSEDALGLKYDAGRVLLTVKADGGRETPATGTIDFADVLGSVGVTEVTGQAAASIDPSYAIDLGVGFDLGADKAFDQRFFLTNGANGQVASVDAEVTADLDVSAVASVLGLRLRDADEDGAVTLLQRKDESKPMLSVALTDPDKDGRTTLAEMSAQAELPVKATVNARVPSTKLEVEADAVGVPLGAGSVTLAWPSVPDTTGSGALSVTADQDFLSTALPFSFDTDNPRALITEVLTVTRETITRMRAAVADGRATTTKPLPLVGKSVADLDPVLGKIQGVVDELIQANDLLTLPALKAKLTELLAERLGSGSADLSAARAAGLSDIVELEYEPRSETAPASVLVKLALGACSTDRAAGREGCTVTDAPLDVPFNLDLGTGSKVGGVAGLGAAGTVKVQYDARANLTFGVQLPTVTPGAKVTDLPTVSGTPKLFVQDDAALDLGVGAKVDGVLSAGLGPVQVSLGRNGEGEPKAHAAVAARFKIATDEPTGARLVVGTPAFDTWLAGLLPKAGEVTVHETDDALKATCEGVESAVDACAALPVFVGSTPLGTVSFEAPDLLTPSGWSVDASQVEANLKNEAIQFSLLVDGFRTLTQQVSEGLKKLPTGTKIPLIGADVTAGADVLDKLDKEVLTRVQTMSTAVASAGTSGAVKTKAEEVLAGIEGLPTGSTPTVTVTCRAETGTTVAPCTGSEPVARLQSFEVGLPLSYSVAGGTGAFDLGFPGLRLASDDEVAGSAGLDVRLGFGVDRDLGFYVPTGGSTPEFAVSAKASLPSRITGDLAFFPVEIVDNNAGNDVVVGASLDLATTRPDGRLPLADLGRAQLTPKLDADATLKLGLRTLKPQGALSALPTFRADLDLAAGVHWSGAPGAKPTTTASIRFDNVAVDAGTLVSDLIKPVAKTLHTYTQPLEKPIEAIKKPIPGVAEAARMVGKTAPTWYDAFKAAAGGNEGVQMIDRVVMFVELVKALNKADAPAGEIPLGSFTVLPGVADQPVPLTEADRLIGTSSVTTNNVIGKLNLKDVDLGEAKTKGGFSFPAFEKPSSLFGMLLGKDVPLVYFDAGKLEVKRGFQFSYPLGPARLYIGGSAGVSGHLAAGFDTYGVRKAFEYLTDDDPSNNGAWSMTKGLLQGLYLDDFDQSGKDVPEIAFTASLSAGASVGLPGLEAGAEGGIEGVAEFNLRTDPAGKLRYTHIAEQLKVNKNPLCFFDATAHIDAYIKAFVDTPFGKADYPIVAKRIYDQPNLFSFCTTPQPDEQQNLLAELNDDGTLVFKTDTAPQSINVRQVAAHTVEVSAQGIEEVYEGVKALSADLQEGDDVLDVQYEVPDETPENPADDVPALSVNACGGGGNDRIMVELGKAELYGDAGPGCLPALKAGSDSLTTGPAMDVVDGGPEADALTTGAGKDKLFGSGGDDALQGGLGDDELEGGSGEDTTDYSDHSEPVTVTLPSPSGQAGEQDSAKDVESVVGGSADDTFNLPADGSVVADGGFGDDTFVSANGTAMVMGGDGDDEFTGGTGAAQFVGSGGNDVLVDGPGAQTFLGLEGRDTVDYSALEEPVRVVLDGEPGDGPRSSPTDNVVDADVVVGTAFDDQLTGGGGSEEFRGGAGADVLEGGPGADVLLGAEGDDALTGNSGPDRLEGGAGVETLRGGADADVLRGEDGADDLDGQDGNDDLDGGADDDRVRGGEGADGLHGGTGFDWVDYSDRTDDLTVTKDGVGNDGAGFGTERDNLHQDVERYVGSAGKDDVSGWSGNEVFEGNDGDDDLGGHGGSDSFRGGDGVDEFYDKRFNDRFDEDDAQVDTFVGGEDRDWAYGNGGADVFDMGAGDDYVFAGPEVDDISGGDGDDEVYAGDGADHVRGDAGDDNIHGDEGDDLLVAGTSEKGSGTVWGGLGADTIHNGLQGGRVTTGTGGGVETDTSTNTVYGYASVPDSHNGYTGALGKDVFHLGDGVDLVYPSDGDDVVELGDGDNTSYASDGNDTVTGGNGRDQISGGKGDDVLSGMGGRDNLYGEAGNDVLDGGADDDGVWGYEGDDVLDGGPNADDIDGGAGVDTVSYADRTTKVILKEDGNFTEGGVEDTSSRPEYPNMKDIVRDGMERYVLGAGDDEVSLGDNSHTVAMVIEGGEGNDVLTVRSTISAPATFVGGPGDDRMTGSSGADTFDQGAARDGADDMVGGGGQDTADYSARPAGTVRVSLDDVANDGARDEGDNVHADVESAPGSTAGEQPELTLSLEDVKVTEGSGRAPARFTVTLSEAAGKPVEVPWSVSGGTATAGRDYQSGSGTVVVPEGETSATFDVTVLGDLLDEADETATVTAGAASGATDKATLTIADDDAAPRVAVTSAAVKEGAKGTSSMTFKVALSAVSGKTVSVRLSTANGTAKSGKDYLAASQVVTFAPGQQVRTVTVKIKGDKVKEKDETFQVRLSAPVNAAAGPPAAGTIRNDDKGRKKS